MWWLLKSAWHEDLPRHIVEVLILSYVFYKILLIIRGTRAMQVLKGIVVLIMGAFIARMLRLYTIDLILRYIFGVATVALLIVFHPELRQALARIGQRPWFSSTQSQHEFIEEMVRSVVRFGEQKQGALLVLEREVGLQDFAETGIRIDGRLTGDLLESIFSPATPLHDGAVIIQGGRVTAAGCVLPLAKRPVKRRALGMRHLAALGASEETDALVIAVSEEDGTISLAEGGRLEPVADRASLRSVLAGFYGKPRRKWWPLAAWRVKESEAGVTASGGLVSGKEDSTVGQDGAAEKGRVE